MSTIDHPVILQGRRCARDLLAVADRIGRAMKQPSRAAVISTALELVGSTAAVDGEKPDDVLRGFASALEWALSRWPEDDRASLLQNVVTEVVDRMRLREAEGPAANETVGHA